MKKKELFWLLGTILFTISINFLLFGSDGLPSESTFNINIHDTYLVIDHLLLILLLSVFIFFNLYLVRVLLQKFKNTTTNLIFLISNVLLILIFTKILLIIHSISNIPSVIASTNAGDEIILQENDTLNVIINICYSVQMLLVLLLAFFGFKTGLHYKNNN